MHRIIINMEHFVGFFCIDQNTFLFLVPTSHLSLTMLIEAILQHFFFLLSSFFVRLSWVCVSFRKREREYNSVRHNLHEADYFFLIYYGEQSPLHSFNQSLIYRIRWYETIGSNKMD